jgi:hypothetical protein
MELVTWSVVGIVVGILAIVSISVLVVGTWFVVMTVVLGVADATIWLLDQGWRVTRRPEERPAFIPMPTSVGMDANTGQAPVAALPAPFSVDRPVPLTLARVALVCSSSSSS